MKKYERLDFNERVNLEKLKDNELFKKKNGTINIWKIAKQMNRDYRTIWQELNMFLIILMIIMLQKHKKNTW